MSVVKKATSCNTKSIVSIVIVVQSIIFAAPSWYIPADDDDGNENSALLFWHIGIKIQDACPQMVKVESGFKCNTYYNTYGTL